MSLEIVQDALDEFVSSFKDLGSKIDKLESEVVRLKAQEESLPKPQTGLKSILGGKETGPDPARQKLLHAREDKIAEIERYRRQRFYLNGTKLWDAFKALTRQRIGAGGDFEEEEKLLMDFGWVAGLSPEDVAAELKSELKDGPPEVFLVHDWCLKWAEYTRRHPDRPRDWMDGFETLRAAARSATDGMFFSALLDGRWTGRRKSLDAYRELIQFDRRFKQAPLPLMMAPYDGERGGVLYTKRKIEALVLPIVGAKPIEFAVVTAMAAVRKEEEVRSFIDQVDTQERERRREEGRMAREDLAELRSREQKFRIEIQRDKRKTRLKGPLETFYQQESISFDSFEEFAERFLTDYITWMSGVTKGNKSLTGATYRVFKQNIGPRWDLLLDEPAYAAQRPKPDQVEALTQKYKGLVENSTSPRALYNLALLLDLYARKKDWTTAKGWYEKAAEAEPKSLWSLYAQDRIKDHDA
ncbi:MAG: hypothetical protein HYT87_11970 [Nitrospirae bacterium]|nr:hypothetical protein [Nitrospirota bacterium]